MNRFAGQGLRFTQTHNGIVVCAPSRSTLMEGKHTGRRESGE